ncbi:MAG: hypothetical protein ABIF82_03235, partial [Planctomycetota bacterium]
MKKLSLFAVMSLLMQGVVGAQVMPVRPAPPAPPARPAPFIMPSLADTFAFDAQLLQERAREFAEQARLRMQDMRMQEMNGLDELDVKQLAETARREAESMRMGRDDIRALTERVR